MEPSTPPYVVAIIAAGGRGRRFGADRPKQLVELSGMSILERTVRAFVEAPSVHEIVVAVPPELSVEPPGWLRATCKPLTVVPGGERRQDSVASAFDQVPQRADIVVIHDAARPFVTAGLIANTIEAALETGAALAALQSRDTVKQAMNHGGAARVAATLPREQIYLAQTPQAFRRNVLQEAIALGRGGVDATDEAALTERAGHPVRLVEGDPRNIKITTPDDLLWAEALMESREDHGTRVGTGYDLHRLSPGRPLIIGGVSIPFSHGLDGHSDADVLCHAVTDAILGAVSAGDIGRHFPDTDARWKGAASLDLLRRAMDVVRARGFEVGNVDAVIIAEHPKLAPYVDAMRANLALAMGIEPDAVSVKGKTNEGVGELGRGEAIAVHAVALLRAIVV